MSNPPVIEIGSSTDDDDSSVVTNERDETILPATTDKHKSRRKVDGQSKKRKSVSKPSSGSEQRKHQSLIATNSTSSKKPIKKKAKLIGENKKRKRIVPTHFGPSTNKIAARPSKGYDTEEENNWHTDNFESRRAPKKLSFNRRATGRRCSVKPLNPRILSSDDESEMDRKLPARKQPTSRKTIPATSSPARGVQVTTFTNEKRSEVNYRNQCWVCEARLRTDNSDSEDGETREPCLYNIHVHPWLSVPICVVCVEEQVAAVEDGDIDPPSDDFKCHGCPSGGDTVFLCDVCPKRFCFDCVEKSHQSKEVARNLMESNDKWACMCCDAPDFLKSIQLGERAVETWDDEQLDPRLLDEKIGAGIYRLDRIEDALDVCDQQDTEEYRERLRSFLGKKLREKESGANAGDSLEEAIQDEIDTIEMEWSRHHARLTDSRTSCQELLESMGVSIDTYYKERNARTKLATDKGGTVEPNWKRRADEALQERDKKERDERQFEVDSDADDSDDDLLKEEILDEVDDLECMEDTDDDAEPEGAKKWRQQNFSNLTRAQRRKIERGQRRLLEQENESFKANGIRVYEVTRAMDDAASKREQEAVVSFRNGVFVRRDEALAVRPPTKRRREVRRLKTWSAKGNGHRPSLSKQPKDHKARANTASPLQRATSRVQRATAGTQELGLDKRTNQSIGQFEDSELWLSETSASGRIVTIARDIAKQLKPHQKEGIKFMWENCFKHLAQAKTREERDNGDGGVILAHHMGLGKSLQTIALLHTLMYHPALLEECSGDHFVRKVLLVVPVNTIKNWVQEIKKWTEKLSSPIWVYDLSLHGRSARAGVVNQWSSRGGVMLLGDALFRNILKDSNPMHELMKTALLDPGPDVIVLDEAHSMLKSSKAKLKECLDKVRTKMKVCLSGTPFQNNLMEYYQIISWLRPGLLGAESSFRYNFVEPIENGMAKDSSQAAVAAQVRKAKELQTITAHVMHRLDKSTLAADLPPLHEMVLYFRQTKFQRKLHHAFKQYWKNDDEVDKRFISQFQALRPLLNHPAALLEPIKDTTRKAKGASSQVIELSSDEEEHETEVVDVERSRSPPPVHDEKKRSEKQIAAAKAAAKPYKGKWWHLALEQNGEEKFRSRNSGYKLVFLLQIIAHANENSEKVVVFTECLRTMALIKRTLESDWSKSVVEGKAHFNSKYSWWRYGVDFLMFDGSTSSGIRGELIEQFNDGNSKAKVFIISIQAGGMGINLCSGTRVVIFDNHWNPTVTNQAIARCWRYGQTQSVFAYRFITEGTMEEKVFARVIKKTNLASKVIDDKHLLRVFSKSELEQIMESDNWAMCDNPACNKWRMLLWENEEETSLIVSDESRKWFCHQNKDVTHNDCAVEERDQHWYATNRKHLGRIQQVCQGERNGRVSHLSNVMKEKCWMTCHECGKRRMLLFETDSERDALSESKWHCNMNQDPLHNSCKDKEQDEHWYFANRDRLAIAYERKDNNHSLSFKQEEEIAAALKMIEKDLILKKLGVGGVVASSKRKKERTRGVGDAKSPKKRSTEYTFASKLVSRVTVASQLLQTSNEDLDLEKRHALEELEAAKKAEALAAEIRINNLSEQTKVSAKCVSFANTTEASHGEVNTQSKEASRFPATGATVDSSSSNDVAGVRRTSVVEEPTTSVSEGHRRERPVSKATGIQVVTGSTLAEAKGVVASEAEVEVVLDSHKVSFQVVKEEKVDKTSGAGTAVAPTPREGQSRIPQSGSSEEIVIDLCNCD